MVKMKTWTKIVDMKMSQNGARNSKKSIVCVSYLLLAKELKTCP